MSSSKFQSYFTNPEYIGGLNAIREHDATASSMGIVYVEDSSDIAFWKTFISQYFVDQYKFQTASQGVAGKPALEALYQGANIKALIAVDSDYDYIKAKYESEHVFNSNPFILHTFGFSRESALIEKNSVQEFIDKCQFTISHQVDIKKFFEQLTKLAWSGLVRFITALMNDDYQSYEQADFHSCFNITDQTFITENLALDCEPLSIINDRLTQLFCHQDFLDSDLSTTEQMLANLGINENNAYRFICGHTIDNLITKIHEQLLSVLYDNEVSSISEQFTGRQIKERIKQINNDFKPRFRLETFYTMYPINNSDEIHKQILDRVASLKSYSI